MLNLPNNTKLILLDRPPDTLSLWLFGLMRHHLCTPDKIVRDTRHLFMTIAATQFWDSDYFWEHYVFFFIIVDKLDRVNRLNRKSFSFNDHSVIKNGFHAQYFHHTFFNLSYACVLDYLFQYLSSSYQTKSLNEGLHCTDLIILLFIFTFRLV